MAMCSNMMLKLLALALAATLASAQFGGKREPPKAPAVKSDIKFIKCQVCEAMAKQAGAIVKELKEAASGKKVRSMDAQLSFGHYTRSTVSHIRSMCCLGGRERHSRKGGEDVRPGSGRW